MINVIKAVYGGMDVTDIVKRYINNDVIRLSVNNNTFEKDPMVGVPKTLDIHLEYNGEEIFYQANEGENYVFPKPKYTEYNSLILTSCNRIDQILLAIAVNKEIIKEDFNLIVADCSTPHLPSSEGVRMHVGDDPYNLINNSNYNPNWQMVEEYVKTISKIKNFAMLHIEPRLSKQMGEANLTTLGLTRAALMGSKYALKLTGVCNLKYNVFSKFNELIGESDAVTWKRTGFNQRSTRVFMGRPDRMVEGFMKAGYYEWIYEYDFIERKFEKVIDTHMSNPHHMDVDERDIIVDEGVGRTDHRKIINENLEKHGLLESEDVWIRKFINGQIW